MGDRTTVEMTLDEIFELEDAYSANVGDGGLAAILGGDEDEPPPFNLKKINIIIPSASSFPQLVPLQDLEERVLSNLGSHSRRRVIFNTLRPANLMLRFPREPDEL